MDIDVDNDFDGKFFEQFRSMGTTDKDVLISQFQSVLGNNTISPEMCAFFLDMNNWNLQNAVCSYYDLEQPSVPNLAMSMVANVTVGEGEAVAPNTVFAKSWRIKNTGRERWPPGCHLKFCSGHDLSFVDRKMVNALVPGETADVSFEMRSPAEPGSYGTLLRMATPTGMWFGDTLNANVEVAMGGLMGITQQLSRIGGGGGEGVSSPGSPCQPALLATPVSMEESSHPLCAQQMPSTQHNLSFQLQPQILAQDANNSKLQDSSLPMVHEEDSEMS